MPITLLRLAWHSVSIIDLRNPAAMKIHQENSNACHEGHQPPDCNPKTKKPATAGAGFSESLLPYRIRSDPQVRRAAKSSANRGSRAATARLPALRRAVVLAPRPCVTC